MNHSRNFTYQFTTMLGAALGMAAQANAGEAGMLTREIWTNLPAGNIAGFTASPRYWQAASSVATFPGAAAPSNAGNSFASRVRGYITAPVSGDYSFWIASDDSSELRLCSSDSKFGRVKIAAVSGWVNPQAWDAQASQRSTLIHLEAGQRYFIEALHVDSGGADHLAIAWQVPGGQRELIPASALESFTADPNDADNDDLADDWEIQQGFSISDNGSANPQQHPLADPDHDGYSNLEEAEYGTNPSLRGGIPGCLSLETWSGIAGTRLQDLTWNPRFTGLPNLSEFVFSAATPANRADNFGSRLQGCVIAPETGNYTFYLAGDDCCELWLSSSESQFAKQKIAAVDGYTGVNQWTKYASQKSATVSLVAGQKYYLEALVKEGGGGDHLEIGWQTPSSTAIAIIPGTALESYALDADDQDGDHLPDSWESAHGLDPLVKDGDRDPDYDGIPNHLEYASSSDPQVKGSISGGLVMEQWLGIPGYSVKALTASVKFLQQPDSKSLVTSAQTTSQSQDSFGSRLRGYLTAPSTGTYTFWVMGDDETEFWLSPSSSKFERQLLVRPALNTGNFDTDISQKSRAVSLTAGQTYYFEILHKDYYGGDFCQVAWTKPGTGREVIPGAVLRSFVPTSEDLDDDDLPDAWESANGLSSADNGLGSPGNGAHGDLDGDGLENAAEWQAGTRADLADTDGDGVGDRDELELLESQVLVADAAPFEQVTSVGGASHSASSGEWTAEGASAVQGAVRGWLEYPVEVPAAGIYRLDCGFTARGEVAGERAYEFAFSVDGAALQRVSALSQDGAAATASVLAPWLPAGVHTLRVLVDNPHRLRHIAIDQIKVLAARGIDPNGNGVPEWVESKLAQRNSLNSLLQSKTSPACVEGKGRWPELIRVAGQVPQPAPDDRWYANVALESAGSTLIAADLENGALHREISVEWLATNLLVESDLVIRSGDALLLTAFTGSSGSHDETVTLTIGEAVTTTTADVPLRVDFPAAGSQSITVTHTQGGQVTQRTVTITAVAAPAPQSPAFLIGHDRELEIPDPGHGVSFAFDQRVSVHESAAITGGYRHTLRLDSLEDRSGLFRLGTGGPVLAALPLHAMRVRDADETGIYFQTDLGNSTWDVAMPLVADGLRSDVSLRYEIFIGGVTFDDGTLVKNLAFPADFNADQSSAVHFYKVGLSGSNCHRLSLWQNGKRIAYRQ